MTGDLDAAAVDRLRDRLRGTVLRPEDAGYDDARSVWNAAVDRAPALVARCRGAADVAAVVEVAREADLSLTVKGGGHHVSGHAVRDGALEIDLGPLDGVRVDPATSTVHVGGGATVGDVDRETQAFGLATPLGQDPNIGVAGLTLGGGFGWLSRQYGLAIDNLRSADVVTADGDLVAASEATNPDLFWALRGGGGNFGVVTALEFDLHPVGPEIVGGSLVHPIEDAPAVARGVRAYARDAPREVGLLLDLRPCPPAPAFPASLHGERVAMVVACAAGSPDTGAAALAPLREIGDPIADTIGPRSYLAMQAAGESQGAMRTDVRIEFLEELTDAAIETVVAAAGAAPPGDAAVFLSPVGGAITDVAPDATALPHRDEGYYVLAEARWTDPAEDDAQRAWIRSFAEAIRPHATGAASPNFVTDAERRERVEAAYGANLPRLVEVKRAWDPEDVFEGAVPVDARGR